MAAQTRGHPYGPRGAGWGGEPALTVKMRDCCIATRARFVGQGGADHLSAAHVLVPVQPMPVMRPLAHVRLVAGRAIGPVAGRRTNAFTTWRIDTRPFA